MQTSNRDVNIREAINSMTAIYSSDAGSCRKTRVATSIRMDASNNRYNNNSRESSKDRDVGTLIK